MSKGDTVMTCRRCGPWSLPSFVALAGAIGYSVLTLCHAAKQQSETGDWPPITPDEKKLTRVEQDPDADAVILRTERVGKIIRKGADTVNVMTFHWRLKVLNERGKRLAEVHIPAQKFSRVDKIQAHTVKVDGTVIPVNPDQIFQKLVSQIGGFKRTEWVFNFPAVEPGAILEYRYERFDNNLLFVDPWYFDGPEFTLRSLVSQAIPSDMGYSLLRQNSGASQPTTTDWREGKEKGHIYTLELHDIPPYRDELFVPPRREVSPRLEMLLTGWSGHYSDALGRQDKLFIDWPSVARYVRYYYQEATKKGLSSLKPQVEAWIQGIADPQERIKVVLRHVQRDFSYLPYDNVIGDSHTLESILKEKTADNEEKAVLLAAALKTIGVDSYVAMVSGRNGGTLTPNFFSLSQFTHNVVVVPRPDGTYQWIDPTVTYAAFGWLPSKDTSAEALLLKTDQGELTKLPGTSEISTTKYRVRVKPRSDGKADLEAEVEYSGEDATDMRDDLAPAAEAARISYLQTWVAERRPGAALRSHTIENLDDVDKPLLVKMSIESPGLVTTAEGLVMVRGCILSCQESNPISSGTRQYPFFLMRGLNSEETVLIEPPKDMKPSGMPAPAVVRSEIGSLTLSCMSQDGGATRCVRQFAARKSVVPASAQGNIRAMYDKIVEADRTTVAFQASEGESTAGR